MTANRRFVLRHGIPGFIGSALIAFGALGVGWLPPSSSILDSPLVYGLRDSLAGSLSARAFVIIGLAMLLQAWLVLGYELLSRGRAQVVTPLRDIIAIVSAWIVPMLLAPPLFSRDAYSYYVQGRVFGAGFDPTTTGINVIPGWFEDGADPTWIESPTPYGPLFLMVERFVANFVHPNAYFGALLFRLVAIVGVMLVAYYLPRLARLHGIDPARALWIGVLNPVLLMHFVAGAHNDALMVGLLVAGITLAAERHFIWGTVVIAMAATVKPIALLVLPFVGLLWSGASSSWPRRIRAWLLTGVVTICAVAPVFLLAGAGGGVLRATFSTPSGVLTWLSPSTLIGKPLGLLMTAVGWTDDPTTVLSIVRLITTGIALLVIAYLIMRPAGRSPVRGAALALAVIVLLGPVVQPWYLLWFLPLFAATGLSVREMRVAVILTAGFTVHGMIESSTNADNLTDIADGITFLVAIAIVLVILLASPRERRLAMGTTDDIGLLPLTKDDHAQSDLMRWPTRARVPA